MGLRKDNIVPHDYRVGRNDPRSRCGVSNEEMTVLRAMLMETSVASSSHRTHTREPFYLPGRNLAPPSETVPARGRRNHARRECSAIPKSSGAARPPPRSDFPSKRLHIRGPRPTSVGLTELASPGDTRSASRPQRFDSAASPGTGARVGSPSAAGTDRRLVRPALLRLSEASAIPGRVVAHRDPREHVGRQQLVQRRVIFALAEFQDPVVW